MSILKNASETIKNVLKAKIGNAKEYSMRRKLSAKIANNIPTTTYKKEAWTNAYKKSMSRDFKGAEKYTKSQLEKGGDIYGKEKLKKMTNW